MKISIVSPIYRAENIVEELVRQIIKNVEPLTHDFEIVLVNDASPDHSWMKIREICRKDSRVKGINLSRNFGQHYAITAGLTYASGEWIVVMDCDLQDRPDEIPNLYAKALEGWDIVYARRVERLDGFWKKMSSRAFHKAYSYLSGSKSDRTIANFGIYKRKVILEYNKMTEKARSFPSLIAYLGFKTTAIDVAHSERYEGSSSYTLSKLVRLTVDVLVSNSTKPLLLAVQFGFVISFISVLLALYNVIAYFTGINLVHGYTTTIFSIWFVGGMTIFVLGIVGLYIGKIFDEVKNRQLFIIDETINLEK
ncbi:glycosyltransferase family 2 protein [Bacteroides sp. GM023]|uniref:glycosyltransferase family 2 protein n=1 Tax=Bacteroides sp. GM023 TaxID=2723058 RepID=UPI00168A57D2|nr:glycosyltransferase family 2 protein [Bacteroides sp. GM023]MBD3588969.1 glycosyltransferase family 2 protein [Bacteroides sp. GM023]